MAEVIPLFPLGSVLFPGLVLPLQVFEPRYRELVGDLQELPSQEQRFGVPTIRQGWEVGEHGVSALYPVGTTARVRSVRPTPDGRYEVVSVGERRFRLLAVDAGSRPYLLGEVEWLDEPEADPAARLMAPAVADAFVGYVCDLAKRKQALAKVSEEQDETRSEETLSGSARSDRARSEDAAPTDDAGSVEDAPCDEVPMREVQMPEDARTLSYMVAASVPLDLADQQSLLEEPTVTDRLRAELRLIRRERVLLAELGSVPVPLARFAAALNPN